jgi:hypothetical protein
MLVALPSALTFVNTPDLLAAGPPKRAGMTMSSASEAVELVRSYSLELENTIPSDTPPHDVRRVFVEQERRLRTQEAEDAPWRSYYEPWVPVDENTHAPSPRKLDNYTNASQRSDNQSIEGESSAS